VIETPGTRIAAVIFLLVTLFGLAIWFGSLSPAPAVGDYPDQEQLGTAYNQYLGDRITVAGTVLTTDPVVIAATYNTGDVIELRITNLDIDAEPGHTLRVYGIVRPDRHVEALSAVAVAPTGLWYTWTVSFLAGLWALARIIRHWKVSRTLGLERRTAPLSFFGGGPDNDA